MGKSAPAASGKESAVKQTAAKVKPNAPATQAKTAEKGGKAASTPASKKNEAKAHEVPVDAEEEPSKKIDIDRFFAFAQCSLKMEAKHFMNHDVDLKDPLAKELWPDVYKMCARNLGKNEKWVPFHTVLGIHELFLVEHVHHANTKWTDYQRFLACFIFRSHCKCELFKDVQMPLMMKDGFWKDPHKAFESDTVMHKHITAFRAKGNTLQTGCFMIIPPRIVEDDDENIILNLLLRTQRLIRLAEGLWPIVSEKKATTDKKYEEIKSMIRAVPLLGDTWVKMLTVVTDIAKPQLKLLQDRCEVGIGAADPLRSILEGEGLLLPKEKRDPVAESKKRGEGFEVYPSIKAGIIAIKKKNKQLLQVTKGRAGTLDRAHAIAELLCEAANKGKNIDQLNQLKTDYCKDETIKVPELGLDAKMDELIARDAEKGPKVDRSGEPTPSEALVQLRDNIMSRKSAAHASFDKVLAEVEEKGRAHFKNLPLIKEQMQTSKKGMSCVTLQVQLCEFRQFENLLSRGTKRPASEA